MATRVTRLTASNFRGVREATIPLNGRNVILVGENGSGKSCWVDMLEYLFTGRLDRLRRSDVKERESVPFAGREPERAVVVELCCAHNNAEHTIATSHPYRKPRLPPAMKDWFHQVGERPPILRRAQILQFIDARGADRYKQVSAIIGLDEVDDILRVWRSVERELKARVQAFEDARSEAETELSGLCSQTGASTLIEAVNLQLGSLGITPISTMEELPERCESLQQKTEVAEASKRAAELRQHADRLDEIAADTSKLLAQYGEFHSVWSDLFGRTELAQQVLFRELLSQGHRLLAGRLDIEACPLCEAPIQRKELLRSLEQRLSELAALDREAQVVRSKRDALARSASGLARLILQAAGVSEGPPSAELETAKQALTALCDDLSKGIFDGRYPSVDNLKSSGWSRWLHGIDTRSRGLREEAKTCQPSEMERRSMELALWLGQVERAWTSRRSAAVEQARGQRAFKQIGLMGKALIAAREERLTEIHQEIGREVNRYYEFLHPGEGCGHVEMPMERRGLSVGLKVDGFCGMSASHPAGFYSEGHLDSMGIVIFLAFQLRFSPAAGFLVLDDVMTTVDRGHRHRLAALLAREFSDQQLLITTHDQLWAQELLSTMRSAGLDCLALHLRSWDIERGVDWIEFLEHRWEEYGQSAETSPQSAVADTGRDFEKLLSTMRFNLGLSVPARAEDQYTIGDLYDPFFSWFKKHSVDHPTLNFDGDMLNLKAELDNYWRLRNWAGAHYNEWGQTLSSAEAKAFIDLVERLHELLQCPACGSLLEYSQQSSALFCLRCRGKPCASLWPVRKK